MNAQHLESTLEAGMIAQEETMAAARMVGQTGRRMWRGLAGLSAALLVGTTTFGIAGYWHAHATHAPAPVAVVAPASSHLSERFWSMKQRQIERLDSSASAPAVTSAQERFYTFKQQQVEAREASSNGTAALTSSASRERFWALKAQQVEQRVDALGTQLAPHTSTARERFLAMEMRQFNQFDGGH